MRLTKSEAQAHLHKMWQFEQSLLGTSRAYAGVDEAGRGCLAGPVTAAAVLLGEDLHTLADVDDSKRLSKKKREQLYDAIHNSARAVAVGMATVEEIDHLNILQASRLAMGRAIAGLGETLQLVLVDGPYGPLYEHTEVPSIPVVDGDAKCLSIAAASIIAKVERDRYMEQLGLSYPEYGFEQNAGYGTPAHLKALAEYGPTVMHRQSFAPVQRHLQVRLDV